MHPAPPASPRVFTLGDFDFHLPPELIAQQPAPERSASRLLDGTQPQPADRIFRDLPALLAPGDLLVFNDTRVLKARLFGEKPQVFDAWVPRWRERLSRESQDGADRRAAGQIGEGGEMDGNGWNRMRSIRLSRGHD